MTNFPNFLRNDETPGGVKLDKNKVLFHHIPKTAGSTLRGILSSMFDPNEVCPAETVDELTSLSANEFEKYRFYAGHFSYGAINKYLSDAIWLTFLREPNERVISQYHNHVNDERIPEDWKRRIDQNPDWKDYKNTIEGMSLEDWVLSENQWANSITCNRQIQAFLPQSTRINVKDWAVYDVELVKIAKKNLKERFHFLGIQEYFDLSFTLFSLTFGLLPMNSSDGFTTNTNQQKKFGSRYEIDDSLSEIIASRNKMDWELYNYGVELFLSRVNNQMAYFAKRDRRLRINELMSQNKRAQNTKENYTAKITDVVGVTGFHAIEFSGKNSFRWTGADQVAKLEFTYPTKQDREYKVCIKLISVIDPSVLKTITITIDDYAIQNPSINKSLMGDCYEINFKLSSECDSDYHLLEISSERKSEDMTRKDARLLGVAISEISIKPHNK